MGLGWIFIIPESVKQTKPTYNLGLCLKGLSIVNYLWSEMEQVTKWGLLQGWFINPITSMMLITCNYSFSWTYKPTYSWRMLGGPTLYCNSVFLFAGYKNSNRVSMSSDTLWLWITGQFSREKNKKRISMGIFHFNHWRHRRFWRLPGKIPMEIRTSMTIVI